MNRKIFKYHKIPIDIMKAKQINLKLPKSLLEAAERYAAIYGYRNIQELASDSIRARVFENDGFDNSFDNDQIEMIDSLIDLSIKNDATVSEAELKKTLLE